MAGFDKPTWEGSIMKDRKDTERPSGVEATPQAANPARRRLLTALAAGGVVGVHDLPERWIKPVVDSVLLPAHAQATLVVFGLTCRADTNNGAFPFPQAPCSDSSQYGHLYTNDVQNVQALVNPTNNGGTVRLVATGTLSGQFLNTTAIVSGGIANFGSINVPNVVQQITFVFSCKGFTCSPNPSTTMTINAVAPP
jgi:hypothetical protein